MRKQILGVSLMSRVLAILLEIVNYGNNITYLLVTFNIFVIYCIVNNGDRCERLSHLELTVGLKVEYYTVPYHTLLEYSRYTESLRVEIVHCCT